MNYKRETLHDVSGNQYGTYHKIAIAEVRGKIYYLWGHDFWFDEDLVITDNTLLILRSNNEEPWEISEWIKQVEEYLDEYES